MSLDNKQIPLENRVNTLFATLLDAAGDEVDAEFVADKVSESLGRAVPAEEITALRQPGATRPEGDLLPALAEVFDMPGSFLSDDPDDYRTAYLQLRLLITQRDNKIPFLAVRPCADSLSNPALQELIRDLKTMG